MKITICLFVSILLSSIIIGQEVKSKPDSKLMIGLHYSPGIAYRYLRSDASESSNDITTIRNETEIIKYGYNIGLTGIFHLTKTLNLEFGIQYTNSGYKSHKIDIPPGLIDSDEFATHFEYKYIYHYAGIPILLNTLLGKEKVRLLLSTGIVTNILIEGTWKSKIYSQDGSEQKYKGNFINNYSITDYNRIHFMPVVSIGINYEVNEKMNLRIAPIFNYGIRRVANAPISEYHWNCGINAGCYFKL